MAAMPASNFGIPINSAPYPDQEMPLGRGQILNSSSFDKRESRKSAPAADNFEDDTSNNLGTQPQSGEARNSAGIPSQTSVPRHHSNGFSSAGISHLHEGNSRGQPFTHNSKQRLENLKKVQSELRLTSDDDPRLPMEDDFPHFISLKIISNDIDEPLEHAIILLHHRGCTEESLESLARRLNKRQHNSAYILLRGFHTVYPADCGYCWADSQDQQYEDFCNTSEKILMNVIKDCLVSKCNFNPKNIMLVGHGQGGMAALAIAASWDEIELGGVVSIGGRMPSNAPAQTKAKTPALIYYAELGNIIPSALQDIKENFKYVDSESRKGTQDTIPESEELSPMLAFFAHRLEREEWEKQAIISFDGGGIRGLGSLLILKDLMDKIGDEERRSDHGEGCAESSFAPCDYRPMMPQTTIRPMARSATESTQSSETSLAVASDTQGLSNSSLYLPCHYFTYAAGTSTGGLISIMLSRLRMTVDDCIKEYKTLGEKIFGHPRPFATKSAIPWHKFSAKAFEDVIRDVTARHDEKHDFTVRYPSDEDLCRTLVFAYADHVKSDIPYFFRTYWTPKINKSESKLHGEIVRNQGEPPGIPIWQVARATSAAPGYLPEIKIRKGNGSGIHDYNRFKDGGFGTNNPSRETYHDIVNKHGGHSKNIGLFLSIGTGNTPYDMFDRGRGILKDPQFWRKPLANFRAATRLPSRTLNAHEDVQHHAYHDGQEFFSYFRFDGGDDLGLLALDEWKSYRAAGLRGKNKEPGCITIRKIELAVAKYLQRRDVQQQMKACAKLLVRRRRLRTRDPSAWDRYASASYYECYWKNCERKKILTAQKYEEHIKDRHHIRVFDQKIVDRIRQSRRCWIYNDQPGIGNVLQEPDQG